jgi:hypothetical protein
MKSNDFQAIAFDMIRRHGFTEARRLCERFRDMNSEGTASYAMHNAVLKKIDLAATVGAVWRSA